MSETQERTKRAPGSLPTREQIAKAWDQAREDSSIPRKRSGSMRPVDAFEAGFRSALALLPQPTPTAEPDREGCEAETHSWDHFRPEQLDAYWIRCTEYGEHDEHRDSNTGLTWSEPSTTRDVSPAAPD